MSEFNINSIIRTAMAALLSLAMIITGTILYLGKDLPETTTPAFDFPASGFQFVLGTGHPVANRIKIDSVVDGRVLISSGPLSLQAKDFKALSYNWQVSNIIQEASFFWRREGSDTNVLKTEIRVSGNYLLDLSTQQNWHGEIIEFGFLLGNETVAIGSISLQPDNLKLRRQLMWQGWTTFEEWSQMSVHFLQGGDYDQIIPLPPLVIAWLFLACFLIWLSLRFWKSNNPTRLLASASMLFLIAWMVLDIRWATNNLRQTRLSYQTMWQPTDQQPSSNDLDGEIHQYIQSIKSDVLRDQPARILIVGDENAVDYYLLRAKYHLLPHSADVTQRFAGALKPGSLDYVIFFGPASGITRVPGWNRSWRQSLVQVNQGEWGVVYQVKKPAL